MSVRLFVMLSRVASHKDNVTLEHTEQYYILYQLNFIYILSLKDPKVSL